MKLTECRCGSSDLSLIISMDLRDPDDSECWIKCNDCGRSGKICIDVEDAIEDWKETDAAEIDNEEMQNRLDEMDSIFVDKILMMYDEPDDKPAFPGVLIRDEIDDFGPDGEEMPSLMKERTSTYITNGRAWTNKTGREILKDMEKLSNEIREAGMRPPGVITFDYWPRLLAQPFDMKKDVEIDIVREPLVKDQWSAAKEGIQTLREYESAENRMREKFRKLLATGQRPPGVDPYKLWSKKEIQHQIERNFSSRKWREAARLPWMQDEKHITAEPDPGDKLALENIEIEKGEVAMITGETYDPSGEGIPLECKVMNMTTQGHVDSEKYPHKCDCGSACWNDGFKIECTNSKCDHVVKT